MKRLFLSSFQRSLIARIGGKRQFLTSAFIRNTSASGLRRTQLLLAQPPKRANVFLRRYASSYPAHEVVGMPALSPTMQTGTIAKWSKKEGDSVSPGEIICQVETDKAVVDFESQDEFYLAKHLVPEGKADIKIGEPIFISVEDESAVSAFKDYVHDKKGTSPSPPKLETKTVAVKCDEAVPRPTSTQAPAAPCRSQPLSDRIIASPLAKKTARENGATLDGIIGTGPRGRIVNADVQKAIQKGGTTFRKAAVGAAHAMTSTETYSDIGLSEAAIQLAQELSQRKVEVPHFHLTVEINLEKVLSAREILNKLHDSQLSVTDFVVRAASLAMKSVPAANSAFMGTFIRQYNDANIALSLSAEGGVVLPVIRHANRKGLRDINNEISNYMDKVSKGSLSLEQTLGATFTITNMGMYGVSSFMGIVGNGQSCILGLGAVEKRVIPNDELNAAQIYKYAHMMTVTLGCDHRVVDGAVGAEWLSAFKTLLEEPLNTML